jgi:hypothetical protein
MLAFAREGCAVLLQGVVWKLVLSRRKTLSQEEVSTSSLKVYRGFKSVQNSHPNGSYEKAKAKAR